MSSEVASLPKIKYVRAYCQAEKVGQKPGGGDDTKQGADCHDVAGAHWIDGNPMPIANPMSRYSDYTGSRKSWGINALGSVVVEVEAEDGTTGVGVSIGGPPACYVVAAHLARFVEGQDPNAIELMHDQMSTASVNYGRKGLTIQAISAVDIALWDLLGKLRKAPVCQLLGGPVRDVLPVYCTSSRPDVAKKLGFVAGKVGCPYGPADGDEGMRKNVEWFKKHREACGPDFPLALDCYMSMTVPYTLRLIDALAPHGLKWIEEYLPPDDYAGYRTVYRQAGGKVMLTTGEHEYTSKGFKLLLDEETVDILQPDVTWVGGITECRRVVAMAAANSKLVIPHGSSHYSYHLQLAFSNTPVAEFINLHPTSEELAPYFGGLFDGEVLPVDGKIFAADMVKKPGFGLTLKKEGLCEPYPRESLPPTPPKVAAPPRHCLPF